MADCAASAIWLVQKNHSFKKYVMKCMRKGYMLKTDKEAYLNSMREKDIHRSLIHPNIVRMLEIIEDESPESSDNDK
jgi:serine/threonine protein kinase